MSKRIKEKGLGKAKKALRRQNKVGLNSYYVMVERQPSEKRLKRYTKLVPVQKASVLVLGRQVGVGTTTKRVKLSRDFKRIA